MWVPDHLAQVDPTVSAEADDMLEAYSVLAYLAGRTERVRLGALVTNVALRPPALLAPAETTADLVARCRRVAGWGVEHLIFVSSRPWARADLDVLVSTVAEVAGLRTEGRTP